MLPAPPTSLLQDSCIYLGPLCSSCAECISGVKGNEWSSLAWLPITKAAVRVEDAAVLMQISPLVPRQLVTVAVVSAATAAGGEGPSMPSTTAAAGPGFGDTTS
jgi:hypothetical protein